MRKLTIHDELRTLLPPLSKDELADLESSMLAHGCLLPMVVWNDILIDGHHRYEICQRYQIPYNTTMMAFEDLAEAKLWAFRQQLGRRNMTAFHRGEVALKLKDAVAAQSKKRQLAGLKQNTVPQNSAEREPSGETRAELARMAAISHDTLGKVEYIVEHADETVKDKLRRGEKGLSIHKTYRTLTKNQEESDKAETTEESTQQKTQRIPGKKSEFVPHTTLKNIPQDDPGILLANLFSYFRDGFVEDLVLLAVEQIDEKSGREAVLKIMKKLNRKYKP